MVVVPAVVVSVDVSTVAVCVDVGSTDAVVGGLHSVTVSVVYVVVVVLELCGAEEVVLDDINGTSVPDGTLEWREVWTTAKTSSPIATKPASAAATTAFGPSYH